MKKKSTTETKKNHNYIKKYTTMHETVASLKILK